MDNAVVLDVDVFFDVLSVFGTIAFGISGAAAAMRVGLDVFGVAVLAILTAVGGGSLRDLAIDNLPMWWIADYWAVFLSLACGLLLIPFRRRFSEEHAPDSWRVVVIADAFGLGAFVVIGASLTLSMGFDPWLAVVMGVVTGTGGGVLRDVLANTKPLIFTGQIYATAAFVGAVSFVALSEMGFRGALHFLLPAITVVVIRLVAIRRRWEFPALRMGR